MLESSLHQLNKQRKQLIKVAINENRQGRVITGMGAGREGNGTRTSLFHLASRIADLNTFQKVCLVDFHLAEPTLDQLFVPDPNKLIMHLDKLYKSINREITESTILGNVILNKNRKNLYLLAGTRRPYSAESFHAEILMAIIEGLKCLFDVVIVNTSAHFDNPGTVAGLLAADDVLVFTNYDENGLRLFNQYYSTIFDYNQEFKEKMLLVGVNSRNGKKENLKQLTESSSFSEELPFVDEWKFSFSDKSRVEGKVKGQYLKGLDLLLQELSLYSVVESKSDRKERKWRLWPTTR